MRVIIKYILEVILTELSAILIFGGAYLIASLLPIDEVSTKIKWGILWLYGISAISLPLVIKYLPKHLIRKNI